MSTPSDLEFVADENIQQLFQIKPFNPNEQKIEIFIRQFEKEEIYTKCNYQKIFDNAPAWLDHAALKGFRAATAPPQTPPRNWNSLCNLLKNLYSEDRSFYLNDVLNREKARPALLVVYMNKCEYICYSDKYTQVDYSDDDKVEWAVTCHLPNYQAPGGSSRVSGEDSDFIQCMEDIHASRVNRNAKFTVKRLETLEAQITQLTSGVAPQGAPPRVLDSNENPLAAPPEVESQDQSVDDKTERVIIMLDVDCFEAQLWTREIAPKLQGKDVPIVIVNLDNIIVSVNYSAKAAGVTRGGGRRALFNARNICPGLKIIRVGMKNGIVDDSLPLESSDKILQVLLDLQQDAKNKIILERKCRDEFFLDVTALVDEIYQKDGHTHVGKISLRSMAVEVKGLSEAKKFHPSPKYNGKPTCVFEGWTEDIKVDVHERKLIVGAVLAYKIINLIVRHTGLHCSGGVGSNKLLAKLASDMNKPKGIALLSEKSFCRIPQRFQVMDIPGFKGKFGEKFSRGFCRYSRQSEVTLQNIRRLGVENVQKLCRRLQFENPEETGLTLFKKCFGKDDSLVTGKLYPDSMHVSLSFLGFHKVHTFIDFITKINNLCEKFIGRLLYSRTTHRRSPNEVSINADMKSDYRVEVQHLNNRMDIDMSVTSQAMKKFIKFYLESNNLPFKSIDRIALKATGFKNLE